MKRFSLKLGGKKKKFEEPTLGMPLGNDTVPSSDADDDLIASLRAYGAPLYASNPEMMEDYSGKAYSEQSLTLVPSPHSVRTTSDASGLHSSQQSMQQSGQQSRASFTEAWHDSAPVDLDDSVDSFDFENHNESESSDDIREESSTASRSRTGSRVGGLAPLQAIVETTSSSVSDEIDSLKRELADAQQVVMAVMGVGRVDRGTCQAASRQVSIMQRELQRLRQEIGGSIEHSQSRKQSLHDAVQEARLISMQEELNKSEAEVNSLLRQISNDGDERHLNELDQCKIDLQHAQEEINDLNQERQANLAEIVLLGKELQGAKSAAEKQRGFVDESAFLALERDYQESQSKVLELEQLLDEVTRMQKGKSLDDSENSGLDYAERVSTLERRLDSRSEQLSKTLQEKDAELAKIRRELREKIRQSSSWETAASESSNQILKMAEHINLTKEYQKQLQDENKQLLEKIDALESKLTETEDVHWMRDQKLSGLQTMYDDAQKRIKDLEGIERKYRKSLRRISKMEESMKAKKAKKRDSNSSFQDSFAYVSEVETSYSEEEAKKAFEEKAKELELSTKKVESMKAELEATHNREAALRAQIRKLQDEKAEMQRDLEDVADRMDTAEKQLINDSSSAMGLEARAIASRNMILKLESEKAALERKMEQMRESGEFDSSEASYESDEEEDKDFHPQLKRSKSTILRLKKKLVETKLEVEESKLSLESERRSHDIQMGRLVEKFEESPTGVLGKEFDRYRRGAEDAERFSTDGSSLKGNPTSMDDEDNHAIIGLRYQAEIMHLQSELDDRDEELRRKEEEYQMQVDQVDSLRESLQEALTNLEDLEFERNFNSLKIQELKTIKGSSDDEDDLRRQLEEKAELCAELQTKLNMAEKEARESLLKIKKLEEERDGNKDKVAELSTVWDTQAKDEVARNQILAKALEVAAQLNEAVVHIEELEAENLELSDNVRALGAKLSRCMQKIDELTEKLKMEKAANAELVKTVSAREARESAQEQTIDMLKEKVADLESRFGKNFGNVQDPLSPSNNRPRPPGDMVKDMISGLDSPEQD